MGSCCGQGSAYLRVHQPSVHKMDVEEVENGHNVRELQGKRSSASKKGLMSQTSMYRM